MTKKYPYHLLIICLSLFFLACKRNGNINIGNNDELTAEVTDSIKVVASTYLLDSLPTSSTGNLLLGTLEDNDLGKVMASSYLRIKPGFSKDVEIPVNAKFDSLTLVLKQGGYNYGDTLVAQHMIVNRLEERIALRKIKGGIEDEERPVFINEDALYSTSSFKYNPIAIGEKTLRVKSFDSVLITLNKSLGAELFQMIISKDKKITDEEEFQDYFKGLVIRSLNGKGVRSYKADSVKMYLNYTYQSNDGMPKRGNVTFVLSSTSYQFNRFEVDRSNTKISSLNYHNKQINAEDTDHQLFIQAGAGLVTKLQLPGLLEFLREPRIVINKFQLIIETKPDTYSSFKPPASLILFIANSSNTPKAVLKTPFAETSQQAFFQKGDEVGSSGRYVFELVQYAGELKKGLYKNSSLLLSLPINELTTSLTRLHIKGNKPSVSIKTKIIYTKY